MSGHAGFLPIGNNIPHPSVNSVPVVDGNENAGNSVNNVQVGGEPQPPAEVPVRAAASYTGTEAGLVRSMSFRVMHRERWRRR